MLCGTFTSKCFKGFRRHPGSHFTDEEPEAQNSLPQWDFAGPGVDPRKALACSCTWGGGGAILRDRPLAVPRSHWEMRA